MSIASCCHFEEPKRAGLFLRPSSCIAVLSPGDSLVFRDENNRNLCSLLCDKLAVWEPSAGHIQWWSTPGVQQPSSALPHLCLLSNRNRRMRGLNTSSPLASRALKCPRASSHCSTCDHPFSFRKKQSIFPLHYA